MTDPSEMRSGRVSRRFWIAAVPLVLFVALFALFGVRLGAGDPNIVPSALLGKPVPEFSLPDLSGAEVGLTRQDLASGKLVLLNVWASWCVPCREEHPILMKLSRDPRFALMGLNYKDDPAKARAFLDQLGQPFARIGSDRTGRTAIDFGVYGVPETFLISGDGRVLLKMVGPLTEDRLSEELEPALEKAKNTQKN
jgi:cytochrome c biogenesis protein CcmG, thiol:disulfide interchange protein DsbE